MDMTPCGFPHSEICGSKVICTSPQLIAAYHVFLRLPVPRHSPCALFSLTVLSSDSSICQLEFCKNCRFLSRTLSYSNIAVSLFSFQGATCSLNLSVQSAAPSHATLSRLILRISAFHASWRQKNFFLKEEVVGSNGLEPSTSRLSGARSNHLSYEPILVEIRRFELLTPCLQSRCSPS